LSALQGSRQRAGRAAMRHNYQRAGSALLGLSKGRTNSDFLPVHFDIKGRTALRNVPHRSREDWRKPPVGGATGSYTMRRTWRKAKNVLKAAGKVGNVLPSYLVTHTMPAECDNVERREHWRRFLDTLRKLKPVCVVWVTERHTGGGPVHGLIHHHAMVVTRSVWWYTKQVRRWSWTYSGTSNGLQIERVRKGIASYLADYLEPAVFSPAPGELVLPEVAGDGNTLPFRWWGYSGVPTSGCTWIHRQDAQWCSFRTPWYDRQRIWVPGWLVADWISAQVLATVMDSTLSLSGPG